MTFVLLATPTFARSPCVEYVMSTIQTHAALNAAGIGFATTMLGGDPYLAKVRNRLTGMFLSKYPQATDLFFLDDDIGWPAHKVVEFLRRPEDIVFGVYPKKQDSLEFPVTLDMAGDDLVENNGVYRANLAPTGFMRIKRGVLERMAMAVGKYHELSSDGTLDVYWNIFEARWVDTAMEVLRRSDLDGLSRDDAIAHLKRALALVAPNELGQWWGEDFWFVERWRGMGGTVWADPDIMFTHRGSKAWEANFADTLRATLEHRRKAA